MLFFIHHDDRLIHRESARERQMQDNSAESVLHHKTLARGALHSDKRSCLRQTLVQVVLRDRLRLKSLGNVAEASSET